jgi:hypothetical protein
MHIEVASCRKLADALKYRSGLRPPVDRRNCVAVVHSLHYALHCNWGRDSFYLLQRCAEQLDFRFE